ncbi:MAG TPA: hypothetical protein VGB19_14480 [Actinomycetota bacterium]
MGDVGAGRPLNALLVSDDFVRRNRWAGWLRTAGYQTATCPGPHVTDGCPRLDDELCPLREWADVAVVDIAGGADSELYGGWAELACTTLPDDGRTVWAHHDDTTAEENEGRKTLAHPVRAEHLIQAARIASRRV